MRNPPDVITNKGTEYKAFTLPKDLLNDQTDATQRLPTNMTISYMNGETATHSIEVDLREHTSYNAWWNHNNFNTGSQLFNYYDRPCMLCGWYRGRGTYIRQTRDYILESTSLKISMYNQIDAKYIKQTFKDGNDRHCILHPIREYFQKLANDATNPRTKANRMTWIRKCERYLLQYENGVPQDELEQVAKALDIAIIITDKTYNEFIRVNTEKCKNKIFKYVNTRLNHCENLTIDLSKDMTVISMADAIRFLEHCKNNDIDNVFRGTSDRPTWIRTSTEQFTVLEENNKEIYDFNNTFDKCILEQEIEYSTNSNQSSNF